MKMTIKNISIKYDSLNSKNVFTNGDSINGRIIVEASKDSPIHSLVLTAVGAAKVLWHENQYVTICKKKYTTAYSIISLKSQKMVCIKSSIHCQAYVTVRAIVNLKKRKKKKSVITSPAAAAVIGKGRNVFPFSFKFPDRSGFVILSPRAPRGCFCLFAWFDFIRCRL